MRNCVRVVLCSIRKKHVSHKVLWRVLGCVNMSLLPPSPSLHLVHHGRERRRFDGQTKASHKTSRTTNRRTALENIEVPSHTTRRRYASASTVLFVVACTYRCCMDDAEVLVSISTLQRKPTIKFFYIYIF